MQDEPNREDAERATVYVDNRDSPGYVVLPGGPSSAGRRDRVAGLTPGQEPQQQPCRGQDERRDADDDRHPLLRAVQTFAEQEPSDPGRPGAGQNRSDDHSGQVSHPPILPHGSHAHERRSIQVGPPGGLTDSLPEETRGHRLWRLPMTEQREVPRRTVLKAGASVGAAGLSTVAMSGPTQAFPGSADDVLPSIDQPAPIPPPAQNIVGHPLVWESLDSRITPNGEFFTVR